jgi:very-short-patch-repair endonuclease
MGDFEAIRGHRRSARWTPVTYGIHRSASAPVRDEHPPCWAEEDLAGWQLLLTNEGCFTALTALELWGIPLPPVPEGCPVFVALAKDDPRPMRAGVHTSRHIHPPAYVVLRGLRVASVAEALTAAARWVGLVDLVAMVDAALHLELVTAEQLEERARSRRPGSRDLRCALALVDGRAESVWESLLRMLHVVCDIRVEPQWTVGDEDGAVIAESDLWLCGTTALHEYDGDEHEKAPRRVKDLRRDRKLDKAGYLRRGYTSGDVLHRAVTILEDSDRSLGRPHDPTRIRAWHELLRTSLFTPAGRATFLERLPTALPRRRTA